MKRQKRDQPEGTGLFRAPAYPFTAEQILASVRSALRQTSHLKITYGDIGRLTAQKLNTAHYWWNESVRPHLLALMCLFEQLTPAARHELFSTYCRTLPSIEHPRLSHDLGNLNLLFEALRRERGITLITSGSDSARTFVLNALGHGFGRLRNGQRAITGVDLHRPTDFVPVSGLAYVNQNGDSGQLRSLVQEIWPEIVASRAPVLLFNRVWPILSTEQKAQIARWAKRRHVILAEPSPIDSAELARVPRRTFKMLAVSPAEQVRSGIRLAHFSK